MTLRHASYAGLVLGAALACRPAQAQPRPGSGQDGVQSGPVLPSSLVPEPRSRWVVSGGVERFGGGVTGGDFLLALATTLRVSAFAPNALFLAKPYLGTTGYEDSRFALGLGLRAYLPVLGTEVSYGFGVLGELRFQDHFWLAYATPLELSCVLYRKNTFEIEVFTGIRRAFTGHLLNVFLLDPNGYENEQAQSDLDHATSEHAWHGFVRLVISRRLD